jgi:UDP-glucuronate 4-epimerase
MTTLITGAFGCTGAWVIRGLLAAGERPVLFDLGDDPWRVRMIAGPDAPERLTVVRGDITARAQLERVVRDHEIRRIIHLAAWQVPLCRQDPPRGASINVTGTAPPLPFPAALDDARYQKDLGPAPPIPLAAGVQLA